MYDLVAIGNPVYDEIITPYIRTRERVLSGCSTNACLAAKKLGLEKVALVGCIGKDYERLFKMHMKRYGVELPKINVSEKTGGFKLVYDRLGNRTLDVLGIAGKILPKDIPKKCLDAKVILIAPILQEINVDVICFLRENSEAQLFLDPQGLIRTIGKKGRITTGCDRHLAAKFTNLVHVIKPNEHESRALTGFEDPFMSAKQLVKWGAEIGIVTLAEKGSVIRRNNQELAIPAYKTLAKDPTGAGDTYAGAFITKFLQNQPLFHCGLFATAAASIKIEHTGPDFTLTHEAVMQRVRELESS
jgi:sugar/nucleoside kinase (ribokinase family)